MSQQGIDKKTDFVNMFRCLLDKRSIGQQLFVGQEAVAGDRINLMLGKARHFAGAIKAIGVWTLAGIAMFGLLCSAKMM